jgi:hypothetical protein
MEGIICTGRSRYGTPYTTKNCNLRSVTEYVFPATPSPPPPRCYEFSLPCNRIVPMSVGSWNDVRETRRRDKECTTRTSRIGRRTRGEVGRRWRRRKSIGPPFLRRDIPNAAGDISEHTRDVSHPGGGGNETTRRRRRRRQRRLPAPTSARHELGRRRDAVRTVPYRSRNDGHVAAAAISKWDRHIRSARHLRIESPRGVPRWMFDHYQSRRLAPSHHRAIVR